MLAVVQGEKILVFEVATGKLRRSFAGHELGTETIAFSRNGRQLVSGGKDCRIFVWDNTGLHGKRHSLKLDSKDLGLLWGDLASENASKANDALWSLVVHPKESVTYMKSQVNLVTDEQLNAMEKLVMELDHDRFRVRDRLRGIWRRSAQQRCRYYSGRCRTSLRK